MREKKIGENKIFFKNVRENNFPPYFVQINIFYIDFHKFFEFPENYQRVEILFFLLFPKMFLAIPAGFMFSDIYHKGFNLFLTTSCSLASC